MVRRSWEARFSLKSTTRTRFVSREHEQEQSTNEWSLIVRICLTLPLCVRDCMTGVGLLTSQHLARTFILGGSASKNLGLKHFSLSFSFLVLPFPIFFILPLTTPKLSLSCFFKNLKKGDNLHKCQTPKISGLKWSLLSHFLSYPGYPCPFMSNILNLWV